MKDIDRKIDFTTTKSAVEDIKEWGFTFAEVRELGVAALHNFNMTFGVDIMDFTVKDIKNLYSNIVSKPYKYKCFFEWLEPRFKKFIELEIPLRIYVGGDKQFITRGDGELEKSLQIVYDIIKKYIDNEQITPAGITMIFYYLNLIF